MTHLADSKLGEPANKTPMNMDAVLVQGLAWTGTVKWITQFLSWGLTLLVFTILSPDDFGLVGMTAVYLAFAQVISEFGLGASIVTNAATTKEQVAQVNSLSVLIGCGVFLLSCAAAVPLATFFHEPAVQTIAILLSLTFVASGFRTVPQALLQREMQFRILALIESGQAVIQSVGTLTCALLGMGYWALVVGPLLGHGASMCATLATRSHSFLWPGIATLRPVFTYSSHVLVSRLSWFGQSQTDFLVAGRILGKTELGAYSVAWNLSSVPIEKVTAIVSRVTVPVFAAVKDDLPTLRRYLTTLTGGLSLLIVGAVVGLALVADKIVPLVLGAKWSEAIAPIRFLALSAVVRGIDPLLANIIYVTGESQFGMVMSIVASLVMPTAFLAGSYWGVGGISLAWLVVYPLVVTPLMLRALQRIQLPLTDYLKALWPAASAACVMSAAVVMVKYSHPTSWSLVEQCVAEIIVGAAVYGAIIGLYHRWLLHECLELFRSKRL